MKAKPLVLPLKAVAMKAALNPALKNAGTSLKLKKQKPAVIEQGTDEAFVARLKGRKR